MKMIFRKTSLRLLILGCFVMALSGMAFSQGIVTGTITGTITDASGAVIRDAPVIATNKQTGVKVAGQTDSGGNISLKDVPIGSYTVVVSASGFSPLTVNNLEVTSGSTSTIGAQHLAVGNTAEQVEVSTAQNLLETSQAQITTTFDTQNITDLPTGGGLDRLTLLIPGVVRTLANNDANTNGVGFSSNGQAWPFQQL
ncbi:MAG: carboxypeptidase-like regulatory domain-containing protein [Edaphobacter sp.]